MWRGREREGEGEERRKAGGGGKEGKRRKGLDHCLDFQVCFMGNTKTTKKYYFNTTGCHYWCVLPQAKELLSEIGSRWGLIPSRTDELNDCVFLGCL